MGMTQNSSSRENWNLLKDGLLWKRAVEGTTQDVQVQAQAFVSQLQDAVKPADALQGLMLDRIAAGNLRKELLLREESAARAYHSAIRTQAPYGKTKEINQSSIVMCGSPMQVAWSGLNIRQEFLLDQGLHRDLILLQHLQSAAQAAAALPERKPTKSERRVIDGPAAEAILTEEQGSGAT